MNRRILSIFGSLLVLNLQAQEAPSATNAPTVDANTAPAATNAAPAVIPAFELNPPPTSPVGSDGLIVPSDNGHPPYMAVFKGSVNGIKNPYGAKGVDAYAAWLNRTAIWAEDNEPGIGWDNVEGNGGWQLEPWGIWVQKDPNHRLILGVPIIPGAWNGSGTTVGLDAHEKIDFETGATGAYNKHYQKLAENLVKNHLGNSILRLGIEFNGGWFAWHVSSEKKAAAFAAYWKQIVDTMRAVHGAEKLQFCWNPGLNCYCAFKPETAWPGDEYVDYIGLDFYDDSYAKDTYPWPKTATPEEIEIIHKKVWDTVYVNGGFGWAFWKKFAEKHQKPLAIPEWGTDNKPDHHGGGDDPYFIEQTYKFINDPANHVAWHSYFDYQAGDGHHELGPSISKKPFVLEFPKSADKFHELFSLPSGTTSTAPATAQAQAPTPTPPAN